MVNWKPVPRKGSTLIIRYGCLLSQAFLPGTSLEPPVIPTAQVSSFTLQYLLYYYYYYYYVVVVVAAADVCHGPFLPRTSLEPTVIPTAQILSVLCVMFQV